MVYKPDEDTSKRDLFFAYRKGWIDGARFTALDSTFTKHDNGDMAAEYDRGYEDGRIANRDAMQVASERLGYKPSVLRIQGSEES